MNLHELKGDVFAGFADLGDGSGAFHEACLGAAGGAVKCPAQRQRRDESPD
jgi:hypothetical protein